MNTKLFIKMWKNLSKNPPTTLKLNDVFYDTAGGRGLTIDLMDKIKLVVWENGTVEIVDFGA